MRTPSGVHCLPERPPEVLQLLSVKTLGEESEIILFLDGALKLPC